MAKGKFERWLTDDGLLLLTAWARDGLTDKQISANCGITDSTLYDWKKRFPEISKALQKGKEPVDIEVENALLKRALGYSYDETREEFEFDQLVKKTVTRKEVVPDVMAQAIWLNNRKPDKWRKNANKESLDEKKFKHEVETDDKRYF